MGDDWHEFFEDHPEYAPEPELKPERPINLGKGSEEKRKQHAAEIQDMVRRAMKEHPTKR